MRITIIDGQGGKLGKMLVEQMKASFPNHTITAIGTNSIATAAMLKSGADFGATGENPVLVACRNSDVIVGPLGIVIADSLLGEITPAMAAAVGASSAQKVLIPINRCNNHIVGSKEHSFAEYIALAVEEIQSFSQSE